MGKLVIFEKPQLLFIAAYEVSINYNGDLHLFLKAFLLVFYHNRAYDRDSYILKYVLKY